MRGRSRLISRHLVAATLMLALASCVSPRRGPRSEPPRVETPPAETPRPEPANALEAGIRPGPRLETLGLSPFSAGRALAAFRASCPDVTRRTDASGLTRPADWATACAAAASWAPSDALAFLAAHLEPVVVGEGSAFATGYYEPEIRGSRERRPGYDVPIYAKPADLLEENPHTGVRGRGRLNAEGEYVLYYDRAEIEQGALAGRGLEIAWAADPVELFFLQIQGSGRLRLPDGSVMRIGYAGQNGREYIAIGRLMRERGLLESPITMQKIVDWLRAHPDEGRALMRENRSYVFFQELTGPGPLGALGRAVTPGVTVAADPKFVPLGAPVLLAGMDNSRANGVWVAQDTGGAIRGANRFDTFWGAGPEAAVTAGAMSSRGRAYLLLPRGTLARLQAARADGAPPQR